VLGYVFSDISILAVDAIVEWYESGVDGFENDFKNNNNNNEFNLLEYAGGLLSMSPSSLIAHQTTESVSSLTEVPVRYQHSSTIIANHDIYDTTIHPLDNADEYFANLVIIGGRFRSINDCVGGERAKRASLEEDEHTRDEIREMATGGYIHY